MPNWLSELIALILVALAFVVLAPKAHGQEHQHGVGDIPDWYDPACCNNRDCHPVKDNEVEFGQDEYGTFVRYIPLDVKYRPKQFKVSQDERYHVCHTPVEATERGHPITLYCFYIRAGV